MRSLCNRYIIVCSPVRGDHLQAFAYRRTNYAISVLYHPYKCELLKLTKVGVSTARMEYDTDSLLEKFSCYNFITCIEVPQMIRPANNSNKLRNVNTVRGRTVHVRIQIREIYNFRIKVIALIIHYGGNKSV